MSDKEKSLIEELNDLPSTLKPIGETPETTESAEPRELIDPMAKPLWEIDTDFLNPFDELPPIQTWVKIGGNPSIPKRAVVCFSAKPKQGKSLSIYSLMIPLLTGKRFDTIEPLETPRLVIVADTEMDKHTILERVQSLKRQLGEQYPRFVVLPLSEVAGKEKRKAMIEEKVKLYSPDMLVIDQVARLVDNYNSEAESKAITDWLLLLAARRTIMTVIHQNKATDNNQKKGHLGSLLEELATENYSVSQKDGVFEVMPDNKRKGKLEKVPFRFAVQDDGTIITATDIVNEQQEKERERLLKQWEDIFGNDEELRHTDLVKRVMEKRNVKESQAKHIITTAASQEKIIEKTDGDNIRSAYRLVRPENDFKDMEEDDI